MSADPDYEYRKELHASYAKERSEADHFALEIGARYERVLSLITGGALVFSLGFVEKFPPPPASVSIWIIGLAWLALIVSLTSLLVAIYSSQNAIQRKIEILDTEISQALHPEDEELQKIDTSQNPFVERTKTANRISLTSAFIGLTALFSFALLNIPTRQKNEPAPSEKTYACPASEHASTTTENDSRNLRPVPEASPPATPAIEERILNEKGHEPNQGPKTDDGDQGIIRADPKPSEATATTTEKQEIKLEPAE